MDPFLEAAIEEARQGLAEGGIPVGSLRRRWTKNQRKHTLNPVPELAQEPALKSEYGQRPKTQI